MKTLVLTLIWLIASVLLAFSQTLPQPPDGIDGLREVHLLSNTFGWIQVKDRVYRTDDGGQHWRDITPRGAPQFLDGVFFLDVKTGWAVFVSGADETVNTLPTLFQTHDGGASWSAHPLQADALKPKWGDAPGAAHIFFVNATDGWIVVRRPSNTAFDDGWIYSTSDAGKTWVQLPNPPTGDPVRFLDRKLGWQAGGAVNDELYVTHDGGRSWTEVVIDSPPEPHHLYRHFTLPSFSTPQDGVLTAVLDIAQEYMTNKAIAVYRTRDGGKTWKLERIEHISAKSVAITATRSGAVWAYATGDAITVASERGIATASDGWPMQAVFWLDFLDIGHGWITVGAGGCATFKSNCWQGQKLLATDDGGRTLTDITPTNP